MKWYKKQMDKLEAKKSDSPKSGKIVVAKKTLGHFFDSKKTGANKTFFPNPVAISKKNRPKTDVY